MRKLILATLLTLVIPVLIIAQSSAFTYQGKLSEAGTRANGPFDFTLRLFSIDTGGTQIGSDIILDNVQVLDGIFTVTLDFGSSPFTGGTGNYLEILVRPGNSTGAYTLLTPRQPIVSVPYSVQTVHAAQADTALNADALGGTPANQFVQTNDPRMSDARVPTPGSPDYIQNTTTQQASSNFNVSGTGKAGIFDAATQFNIGGSRFLTNAGTRNVFAGVFAGEQNTTGDSNSFVGEGAGRNNTAGSNNSFFGQGAGNANTTGNFNAFFGHRAGLSNTTAGGNAIFGSGAGSSNTTGSENSFFGTDTGFTNTTGSFNTFFGSGAGETNVTGNHNTSIGDLADVNTSLQNATSIGANAFVNQSNSLVLGSINGLNGATADTNVGIGTTAPTQRLHVVGDGLFTGDLTVNGTLNANLPTNSGSYIQNTTTQQAASNFNVSGDGTAGGTLTGNIVAATMQFNIGSNRILSTPGSSNIFAGASAGNANTTGFGNSFFGPLSGFFNTAGSQNSFFGTTAGSGNTTGINNTAIGYQTSVGGVLNNVTAIGAFASVTQANSLVLGSINGVNGCGGVSCGDTNVGIGTTAPTQRLHVVGNGLFTGTVRANGGMYIPNPNTLVITSPNGFCWGITVSNSGVLSAFPVAPCP